LCSIVVNNFIEKSGGETKAILKAAGKNQPRAELKLIHAGQASLYGDVSISFFLARANNVLLGNSPLDEALCIQWINEVSMSATLGHDPVQIERLLHLAEHHLQMRTTFVGYTFSLADIAMWCCLTSQMKKPVSAKLFPNVFRWKALCDAHTDQLFRLPNSTKPNSGAASSADAKKKGSNAPRVKLLTLEGAKEGNVVTRFPPEPSGFMHLGHCKAALLNYHFAQHYKGKLVLRFDDTNPQKATQAFEDAIRADVATLCIKPWKVTHTSDHFPLLIDTCRKMIASGDLYVDTQTGEEISAQRKNRQPSPNRDQSIEKNLALFDEMLKGSDVGVKCVVRAKMDPTSDVGCLRDPNMFRCVTDAHYRTGKKYNAYPLYDFACPIIDSIEGVTHALRSNEYHDRDFIYKWMFEKTKLRPVIIHDFGRLSFSYTLLSKRKLQWFVTNDIVDAWDHPSFPTVRGMLRRGLTLEALRTYILQQGSSKNIVLNDTLKLWAENRKVIDPIVPRYHAVSIEQPCLLRVLNFPDTGVFAKTLPCHKRNPKLGDKVVIFSDQVYVEQADAARVKIGEKVTLMDWGNAHVRHVESGDNNTIKELHVELALEDTDFSGTKRLTWVANHPASVFVDLVEYDTLISKPKLEKEKKNRPGDKFEDFARTKLDYHTLAIGDANLKNLKKGDKIQLERRGYFIVDVSHSEKKSAASSSSNDDDDRHPTITLIKIPEGKLKDVSILSSKVQTRT